MAVEVELIQHGNCTLPRRRKLASTVVLLLSTEEESRK